MCGSQITGSCKTLDNHMENVAVNLLSSKNEDNYIIVIIFITTAIFCHNFGTPKTTNFYLGQNLMEN